MLPTREENKINYGALDNLNKVDKLIMITKETLLNLISEEKDDFSKYSQSCANYQITPDPIALAKHQGRLEIIQRLLREKFSTKT